MPTPSRTEMFKAFAIGCGVGLAGVIVITFVSLFR